MCIFNKNFWVIVSQKPWSWDYMSQTATDYSEEVQRSQASQDFSVL